MFANLNLNLNRNPNRSRLMHLIVSVSDRNAGERKWTLVILIGAMFGEICYNSGVRPPFPTSPPFTPGVASHEEVHGDLSARFL